METSATLSDIPDLPAPDPDMTWRFLNKFDKNDRQADFYLTCLKYGQHLWRKRLPARAILCLDRAWGADLAANEPVLRRWPLPYEALAHVLKHAPKDAFLGNPRVHFQHYADRVGEPRRDQRKWRSWACWAVACAVRPDFLGDPKHQIEEPTFDEIRHHLGIHGHPKEIELWLGVIAKTR